jgi:hypothetical protein
MVKKEFSSRKRPTHIGKWLALATIVFVFVLVIPELIFRFFMVHSWIPSTQKDFDKTIASSWPYPIPIKKKAASTRVLHLADSFGVAGLKRNFIYLLAGHLHQNFPGVQMVNLSKGGIDVPDELRLFKRFGPRYQPDLVLHSFFVGNDFDLAPGELVVYRNIVMRKPTGLRILLPHKFLWVQWVRRYVMVMRDNYEKKSEANQQSLNKTNTHKNKRKTGTFSEDNFLKLEYNRLRYCHKNAKDQLKQILPVLDQVRKEVTKTGAMYAIIIHPDQYQVETILRHRLDQKFGIDFEHDYDLNQPQNILKTYCESHKIPYLDLLPAFKAVGNQGGLYILHDSHYNKAGNALAAKEIYTFLKREELLKIFTHQSN